MSEEVDTEDFEIRAHEAYVELLKQPLGTIGRMHADKAMAFFRDYLADITNEDPEMVQMAYEEHAAMELAK